MEGCTQTEAAFGERDSGAQGHKLPLGYRMPCRQRSISWFVWFLGEGCIALQSGATESQVPIRTVLTHHGEKTGIFQGEFKLQTSQGKQREKLYGKPTDPAQSHSWPCKNFCDALKELVLLPPATVGEHCLHDYNVILGN